MKSAWIPVSPELAEQHPLYGTRGWLIVLSVGAASGFLLELGNINNLARDVGMMFGEFLDIDHPAITFIKTSLWINAATVAVIYWALFTRQRFFRQLASGLFIGVFPALILIGMLSEFKGLGKIAVFGTFQWIISCAVWVTYLQRSRRVRVTFEHLVRADDPLVAVHEQSPNVARPTVGMPSPAPASLLMAPSLSTAPVDEDAIYAQVADELDSGQIDKGLWTRLYADHEGAEVKTRVAYIRERSARLRAAESLPQHGA